VRSPTGDRNVLRLALLRSHRQPGLTLLSLSRSQKRKRRLPATLAFVSMDHHRTLQLPPIISRLPPCTHSETCNPRSEQSSGRSGRSKYAPIENYLSCDPHRLASRVHLLRWRQVADRVGWIMLVIGHARTVLLRHPARLHFQRRCYASSGRESEAWVNG